MSTSTSTPALFGLSSATGTQIERPEAVQPAQWCSLL